MESVLKLCILNTHYRYTGCITAKKLLLALLEKMLCGGSWTPDCIYCKIDKTIATGLLKYQEYRFGIP